MTVFKIVFVLDFEIFKGKRDFRGVLWLWNKIIRGSIKEFVFEGRGVEKE